jgi:hypothetical protein
LNRGEFLRSVWSEGRARVAIVSLADLEGPPASEDLAAVIPAIEECAAQDQRHFPGLPPELDRHAAAWGLEMLYRACVGVVFRDLDRQSLEVLFALRCPAEPSPISAYSVDLSLRFLPDVVRIARAASGNDPLLNPLMRLATEWPLSSVGVSLPEPGDISGFWSDPGLRRLYVDRVLEHNDLSRLDRAEVREAVRAALGDSSELSPKAFDALLKAEGEKPVTER